MAAKIFFNVWVMPIAQKKCACGHKGEKGHVWQTGEYVAGKWRSRGWPVVCQECWKESISLFTNLVSGRVTHFEARSGYGPVPSWMVLPCKDHLDCIENPKIGLTCSQRGGHV